MALKFCPKCGNELEPDALFCDACGARLKERSETSEVSTPPISEPSQAQKIKPEGIIYAPFLKRLIALILDSIIIGIVSSPTSWLLINPWYDVNIFDPFGGWWLTMPLNFILGFLYHWGLETYNNGQTLGKMALGIRTVDEKTLGQATSSNYAINNIFKGSALLIIDFLIGIFKNSGDPKNQIRIMQYVSETVVIMKN
ncbi:MAG: RDD family protein [Candidatus Hermodarchaeota archaeon]